MKTLIFLILIVFSFNIFAQTNDLISDLASGSEITVLLDKPEFYANNKLEWVIFTPKYKIRCSLSTHTYFDEDLVRSLRKIAYTVKDVSYSDNTGKFVNNVSHSQWNVHLDHPNKAIPLISMSCMHEEPKANFTMAKIEELTQGEISFTKKILSPQGFTPMFTLMPNYFYSVKVLTPMSFTFTTTSQNSGTPSQLYAVDGQLSNTYIKSDSSCDLSYSWTSMSKNQEITLQPGTLLDQNYISQHYNLMQDRIFYSFTIQSTMAQGLRITCRSNQPFTRFSEIQNHLKGIIEFN